MNSKRSFLILLSIALFLTSSIQAFAQLENYLWWYGNSPLGISFNSITKQPTSISGQYTPYGAEGCSVICDPFTGSLLYYSDGIRAVDASHRVMPNGAGLLGNTSSSQNGWSCPVPGECNKYYIFSNSCAYESNISGTLYFSIVDMSLPGNGTVAAPLGDIQVKNTNILAGTSEAISLVKGSVRGEYWLLAPLSGSSQIAVLKISTGGIVNQGNFNTSIPIKDIRNIRYSEQAGKFVVIGLYGTDPSVICDFNKTTGVISNPITMPGTPFFNVAINYQGAYDAEWSADGTKLYVSLYRWNPTSSGGRIYQYDLNTPLVGPVLIFNNGGTFSNFGAGLKRGPDDRIYWIYTSTVFNSNQYIGVINSPNLAGAACNFDPVGLDMGASQGASSKFPDFLVYNNASPLALDFINTNTCITNTDTDIDVSGSNSEPDGDPLSVTIINVKYGSAVVLPDNTIRYTKPSSSPGGNDTIWYEVCDNQCPPLCDAAYAVVNICTPLPVAFTSFSCMKAGDGTVLNWITASEMNSSFFAVERSMDGINFENIVIINSKGFSNEQMNYTYTDASTSRGETIYYRLKQVDRDGKFSYSKVISFSASRSSIEVFPNPIAVGSPLQLIVRGGGEIHVNFSDLTGKMLFEKNLTSESRTEQFYLNISGLSAGIYILSVTSDLLNEFRKIVIK